MDKFDTIIEGINNYIDGRHPLEILESGSESERLDFLESAEFAIITAYRADGHIASIGQQIAKAKASEDKEAIMDILKTNEKYIKGGNESKMGELIGELGNVEFIKVEGKYPEEITGISLIEQAVLVLLPDEGTRAEITRLSRIATSFNQDSILVGSDTQEMRYSLVYPNKIEGLGHSLMSTTALDDYYTKFEDGKYFRVFTIYDTV